MAKSIGEILKEAGIITPLQLELALREQKRTGEKLGQILLRLGFVTEDELLKALGIQWKIPYVDLSSIVIDPKAFQLIPEKMARKYRLIPIARKDDTIVLAMSNPNDIVAIDAVRRKTGLQVETRLSDEESILKAIEALYGITESIEDTIEKNLKEALLDEKIEENKKPIVKLVDMLILKGIFEGATDIHFEPDERVLRVRYRIDGILHHLFTLPKKISSPVVSRLKVLSGLDIAEQRMPQDGAFTFPYGLKEIDIRVSTYPTLYGESVVLRVLEKTNLLLGLKQLGLSQENLRNFLSVIEKPYGMIIVTGPTGSGKTTTLYACLQEINALEKNIMTVEDPIEYKLPFIRQSQVNERAGFTFANALRHILRHDPDVILVGEMRDKETIDMAFRASMTGHLVFTTLHANSSLAAIPRLLEMGVAPYILSTTLLAIMAQRLVRKICPQCKEAYEVTGEEREKWNLPEDVTKLYRGKGCEFCHGTGYRGRTGIFELLIVTPEVSELIMRGASPFEIERVSKLKTLRDDGIDKVVEGITTLDEIQRVVG
jgi:type IV pilus assembly protein PilB